MHFRLGYAFRETFSNLRRNLLLTTASMLTVAVSLSLVGSAFLVRWGVDNATKQWKSGVEFEVFMNADATEAQMDLVGRSLLRNPDVDEIEFFSQEKNYELFKVLFKDQPAYLENASEEIIPPSYRVDPSVDDADQIQAIADQIEDEAGVREVAFPAERVREVLEASNIMQRVILVTAVVVLFSGALLIFNAIRMAIFARRREIEVMKLVGATNSFIRVPFMLEGLIQGLVGAAVAFALVYFGSGPASDFITRFQLFQNFVLLQQQVLSTGFIVAVVGAVLGAIGAGVAVTRFLDV